MKVKYKTRDTEDTYTVDMRYTVGHLQIGECFTIDKKSFSKENLQEHIDFGMGLTLERFINNIQNKIK